MEGFVAHVTAPDDVYKAIRWRKLDDGYHRLLFRLAGNFLTNRDKAQAVGQAKLTRRMASDDIEDV